MGWFDEDDSDEEEEAKQAAIKKPGTTNDSGDAGAAEEEDPLDAYMKTLQPAMSTPSKTRAERLDIDNADEATSHWQERDANKAEQEEEDEYNNAKNSEAQVALDNTFRKAGGATPANTNVSIQLVPVRHEQMKYRPIQRILLMDVEKGGAASVAAKAWRKEHHVSCTPTNTIDPVMSFAAIAPLLSSQSSSVVNTITEQITKCGYTTPTPVQSQTLAVAMAGHDALVTASTGSGKTMAYVWPMLFHIQLNNTSQQQLKEGPQGLILVPTREIALQVHKHVKAMTSHTKGASVAITGGVNRYQLVQDLKRHPVQIVVATPGRLLDVLSIKKNGLSLQYVTFLVLDECDKMLDMGFEDQVQQLLTNVRPDRQSLLLSATLGKRVERVANQWLSKRNSIRIAVGHTGRASDHVQQHVMVLPNFDSKKTWLQELLPTFATVGLTLVFVATRVDCETLATSIQKSNPTLGIATLHGDKHATDRHAALRAFGKDTNPVKTLICTDVASRGLDLHVATVISFDPAKNLDIHVHRIGRAGRLAKKEGGYREGTAYTLLTKKNADFAHILMQSFEREGREISAELRNLAQQSRRSGNTAAASREKWNKAGLGFDDGDASRYGPASSRSEDLEKASPSSTPLKGSYYGPSATVQSPAAGGNDANLTSRWTPPGKTPPKSDDDDNLETRWTPPAKKSRWG